MFNNQGNSKPEASQKENGDMAWAGCEELVELDDVQLATVVGGTVTVVVGTQVLGVEYGFEGIFSKESIVWNVDGAAKGLVSGKYAGQATGDGVVALLVLESHLQP